jgi:tRNA(Ile)-lysidine synthetase-like protein
MFFVRLQKGVLGIKKILSKVRKAVDDYSMIGEGDLVAVGISGGKDSLTLFMALNKLKEFYSKKFEIIGITLDMGLNSPDFSNIIKLSNAIGAQYQVHQTLIGKIVFEERKEKNPCSLCANLRRGALNNIAKELGCNKVALGHHKDDAIETLMMSLLYEGNIHTFSPVTYLKRKDLHVIRPLVYTDEKEIKYFAKKNNIPVVKSNCEYDGHTKRQFIKDMLFEISKETKDVKSSIFGAIQRSGIDDWINPKA